MGSILSFFIVDIVVVDARDQVRSGSIHQVQRMGMSRLLMVFGNALCCPVVAIGCASAFSGSDVVDILAGQGLYSQSLD